MEGFENGARVAEASRFELPIAQPSLQQLSAHGVVVDNQHVRSREQLREDFQARGSRWAAEACREGESAAATDLAVHAQVAAHQRNQASRDGQTKACSAVLPRRRHVFLLECLEDRALLVQRDADASVSNGEVKLDVS